MKTTVKRHITELAKQRIAGALFLAAFLAYGIGANLVALLVESANATSTVLNGRSHLVAGCILMLFNSAIVVGIALLLRPALAKTNASTANFYLATRVVEGVALAVGSITLLSLALSGESLSLSHVTFARRTNFLGYQAGMLVLCLGSLPFCLLLLRQKFVPVWLALWGLAGYALLALGALLELTGLPYGIALSVPGGLFEFVFGSWLIARGLKR